MKVIFRVTQDQINSGQPKDVCSCPVALSLSKRLKEGYKVVVCEDAIVFSEYEKDEHYGIHSKRLFSIPLPKSIGDFISRFDHDIPVEPFSFSLTDERLEEIIQDECVEI